MDVYIHIYLVTPIHRNIQKLYIRSLVRMYVTVSLFSLFLFINFQLKVEFEKLGFGINHACLVYFSKMIIGRLGYGIIPACLLTWSWYNSCLPFYLVMV